MQRISKGFLITWFFVSSSLPSYSWAAIVVERLEAAVNNQIILKSDLSKFRKTLVLRTQLDPLFGGTAIAEEGLRASDPSILEFLIDEQIILQQFPMSDADVEQEVNSIQANNHISREQLRQAIQAQGFRFEDYFSLIRIGAAKRNLIDREIRTKVTVSDDDVRNYYYTSYAKNKPAPQAYQVQIITHKDSSKIAEALKEVHGGNNFSEVAKKYSQDSSAESGGELGILTEEQMSKGIRSELKKLKVGETSSILGDKKSSFFFLRLASVRTADDQRLKQVSDQIRAQLASGEYQRQLHLWLERQRQSAYISRAGNTLAAGLPKGP